MKKLALTIAIVLGIGFSAFADGIKGGGMFQRGTANEERNMGYFEMTRNQGMPSLPMHGETGNQDAPLGSSVLLLLGFGAVYALKKRKESE